MSLLACTDLTVRPAQLERDFAALCELEAASYPADEAASPEKFRLRLTAAGEYFKALEATVDGPAGKQRRLIGLVCGTRTEADFLDHASMSSHSPTGGSLCLHSVVVAAPFRKKGIASWMLTTYLRQVLWQDAVGSAGGASCPIQRVLLLAHADKTGLYARLGFESRGPSPVVHGAEVWMEMCLRPSAVFNTPSVSSLPLPARLPFWMVDAFQAAEGPDAQPRAGSGNPAAVVVCPTPLALHATSSPQSAFPLDQATMAALALELAVPATVFIVPRHAEEDDDAAGLGGASAPAAGWSVRFFNSTGAELPVCGHASLAAARVLFSAGFAAPCEAAVTLLAKQAVLRVALPRPSAGGGPGAGDCGWGRYALTLPADACTPPPDSQPLRAELAAALGLGSAGEDIMALSRGRLDLVVHLTPTAFAAFSSRVPDYSLLRCGALSSYRILTVACFDAESKTATTRCFNAAANPPEDPACGAAHCTLGSYLGAPSFVSHQASPRGAFFSVAVEAKADGAPAFVTLTGAAATVTCGQLAQGVTQALLAKQA